MRRISILMPGTQTLKAQTKMDLFKSLTFDQHPTLHFRRTTAWLGGHTLMGCLLYTSDADDALPCVDLGGRRNVDKKKNKRET